MQFETLVKKAEDILKSEKSFFKFFYDKDTMLSNACDILKNAANLKRQEGSLLEAGEIFERIADISSRTSYCLDSINALLEASRCYKLVSMEKYEQIMLKMNTFHVNKGDYVKSSKCLSDLATFFKGNDNEKALHYQTLLLSSNTLGDMSPHATLQVLCELEILQYKYESALSHYSTLIEISKDNSGYMWNVNKYIFNSLLIRLCTTDQVDTNIVFERFIATHPRFKNSSEARYCELFIKDVENEDLPSFLEHVAEMDEKSTLTQVHLTLLLNIKSKFNTIEL